MDFFQNFLQYDIGYHIALGDFLKITLHHKLLQLRFRKAGKVRCGGARETH